MGPLPRYSYNTLFDLMVVNNYNIITEGHVAMTSRWARLYFYVYFLFVVLVVLNVVVAFILDGFVTVGPLLEGWRDEDRAPWCVRQGKTIGGERPPQLMVCWWAGTAGSGPSGGRAGGKRNGGTRMVMTGGGSGGLRRPCRRRRRPPRWSRHRLRRAGP